jgi:predicted DNA-binding transcriptional regulator AlpA
MTASTSPFAGQIAAAKKAAALKAAAGKKTGTPPPIIEDGNPLVGAEADADGNGGEGRAHQPRGPPRPKNDQTSRRLRQKKFDDKVAALRAACEPLGVRLMSKAEVCAVAGCTFPSLWVWMRRGSFPRSRIVHGKSMWLSREIEEWLANLPVRQLKPPDQQSKESKRGRKGKHSPSSSLVAGTQT